LKNWTARWALTPPHFGRYAGGAKARIIMIGADLEATFSPANLTI
jgi:hypothetical protein